VLTTELNSTPVDETEQADTITLIESATLGTRQRLTEGQPDWVLLRRIDRLCRLDAWASKLPPFCIAVLIAGDIPAPAFCAGFAFLVVHLASGYVANDVAEWDTDIAAGDAKPLHRLGTKQAWLLLLPLSGAAVASATAGALVAGNALPVLVGGSSIVAHFGYSFWPRLKARGSFGVVSSAFNQWVAAYAYTLSLVNGSDFGREGRGYLVGVLLTWLLALGIHGSLRHQFRDFDYDLGRTATFAARVGRANTLGAVRIARLAVVTLSLTPCFLFPNWEGVRMTCILTSFAVYHLVYYKRLETR
jgi:4-hydroxybenzoate polyprenyltransferase